MVDTLRIRQRDPDEDPSSDGVSAEESPERDQRAPVDKQARPAGLRFQVFTPPPFEEGPLWGVPKTEQADGESTPSADVAVPWTTRYRQPIAAAALAALGGLLFTAGMVVTKLHGNTSVHPTATVSAIAAPSATAVDTASASSIPAVSSSSGSDPVASSVPTVIKAHPKAESTTTAPTLSTASAHPSVEARDASAPVVELKDASAGKSLILSDAPF